MEEFNGMMLFQQVLHLARYHTGKRLEKMNLKPGQVGILFLLSQENGQTGRKLAEKAGITPPSMTVAIKKLEGMGYVQKVADTKDQRMMHIYLTEEGRGCIQDMKAIVSEVEDVLCQGFSQEEKIILRRLLLAMRDNLMNLKEFRGMDVCEAMEKSRPPKMPGDPFA